MNKKKQKNFVNLELESAVGRMWVPIRLIKVFCFFSSKKMLASLSATISSAGGVVSVASSWLGRRLFSDQVQCDLAPLRPAAVLEQIDALPSTERHFSPRHRNRKLHLGERGAEVGGHVIWSLDLVDVAAGCLGRDPVEEGFQVGPQVRVGVLLDQQRRGSVAAEAGPLAAMRTHRGSAAMPAHLGSGGGSMRNRYWCA